MSDNTGKIIDDLVNQSYENSRSIIGEVRACNCVGPQRGETLCPCMLSAKREKDHAMIRDGIEIDGKRYRLVPEEAMKA